MKETQKNNQRRKVLRVNVENGKGNRAGKQAGRQAAAAVLEQQKKLSCLYFYTMAIMLNNS